MAKSFMELAEQRYSVRKFSDRPIPQELLDKIIEAGRLAPTAKNNQPQRVYVIRSPEALEKVDKLTPCRYGAPTVLLFTYNKDEQWTSPTEKDVSSGQEDVSLVATHMMFEAQELGLGTLWINLFGNTETEKAFGIPPNERSVLLMDLGYPAPDARPSSRHSSRRPVSETVRYL